MNEKVGNEIHRLGQHNLALRYQLEQAELHVPLINQQLTQLANTYLLPDTILLGDILQTLAYSASDGPHDSGQVLQAALLLPGGLGIVRWDTEEYVAFNRSMQVATEAVNKFVPFEQCCLAEKALLLPQAQPLLEQLLTAIRPMH